MVALFRVAWFTTLLTLAMALHGCGGGDSPVILPPSPVDPVDPAEPVDPVDPDPVDPVDPVDTGDPEARSRLLFPFRGSYEIDFITRIDGQPLQTPADAINMPVFSVEGSHEIDYERPARMFVGVEQFLGPDVPFIKGAAGDILPIIGTRGDFDIRYGRVEDAPGANEVGAYLHDLDLYGTVELDRFTEPPVVWPGGTLSKVEFDIVLRAVQVVNAALPTHWKLRVLSETPASVEVMQERGPYITVDFISPAEWRAFGFPPTGLAGIAIAALPHYGHVYVGEFSVDDAPNVRTQAIGIVVHELLHTLGVGHVNSGPGWESIMIGHGSERILQLDEARPLSSLYLIDREALRVRYDRLNRGDVPAYKPRPLPLPKPQTTRGNFEVTYQNAGDAVYHVSVESQLVYLASGGGLSLFSGYGHDGQHPSPPIADNATLEGSVTWRGILAGFSAPEGQEREFSSYFPPGTTYSSAWIDHLVLGDAEFSINLDDLTGSAVFSNLETWDPGQPPGEAGTGRKWGDGSLRIPIAVADNTISGEIEHPFSRGITYTTINGSFLGPKHEVISGTLSKGASLDNPHDLMAAFGAVRDGVFDTKPPASGPLNSASDMADFGPWTSESLHVTGNGQHVGFGTAWRNGYGEPWAHGYKPETDLADNRALEGTVVWNGNLVGFTPEASVVAGEARLAVSLSELTGSAVFDNMEAWAPNLQPGDIDTGALWGDGDLRYGIVVNGNTFKQSGEGDSGILTGLFLGAGHEGVGGTLVREDLTAAFGGER